MVIGLPQKNSKDNWESSDLNRQTYFMYYDQLKNMVMNLFKWEGLPSTVNPRFMEEVLFEQGHAGFCNDPNFGFICVPANLRGFNMYNEPTEVHAWATGYNGDFTPDQDCVIIYNNEMKKDSEHIVRLYAQRLTEVERTIDVNIKAQKTPIMILCEEQQRMTMKNLMMKYDGNEPLIYGNKSLDLEGIKVLNLEAPFVADKLIQYKHSLWGECMTMIGLSNANTDKKERLVEAEVTSNDEQIESAKNVLLNQRELACKKINKIFGLNISVKFRNEVEQDVSIHGDDKKPSGE